MRRLLVLLVLLVGGCTPMASGPVESSSPPSTLDTPDLPAVLVMPQDLFAYAYRVQTYTDATLKQQTSREVTQRITGVLADGSVAGYIDEQGILLPGPRVNVIKTPWLHHAVPGPGVVRISASYQMDDARAGEAIVCDIIGPGDKVVPGTEGVSVVKGSLRGTAVVLCGSIEF